MCKSTLHIFARDLGVSNFFLQSVRYNFSQIYIISRKERCDQATELPNWHCFNITLVLKQAWPQQQVHAVAVPLSIPFDNFSNAQRSRMYACSAAYYYTTSDRFPSQSKKLALHARENPTNHGKEVVLTCLEQELRRHTTANVICIPSANPTQSKPLIGFSHAAVARGLVTRHTRTFSTPRKP